jgi:hypothetical protein
VVITAGLALARADGYVFDGVLPGKITTTVLKGNISTAPTMGVRSESSKEEHKRTVEVLEWQFEKLNSNYGDMKRIAGQFADLLNGAEPIDEEIQWGAPLLRRSVERMKDGSDPVPRGAGGGPYRPLYVPVPMMEGEAGEAEGD